MVVVMLSMNYANSNHQRNFKNLQIEFVDILTNIKSLAYCANLF